MPPCKHMNTLAGCDGAACPDYHTNVECYYFPRCDNGEECRFLHPRIPCRYHNTPGGCTRDPCNYLHLKPCRYGSGCKNYKHCTYYHEGDEDEDCEVPVFPRPQPVRTVTTTATATPATTWVYRQQTANWMQQMSSMQPRFQLMALACAMATQQQASGQTVPHAAPKKPVNKGIKPVNDTQAKSQSSKGTKDPSAKAAGDADRQIVRAAAVTAAAPALQVPVPANTTEHSVSVEKRHVTVEQPAMEVYFLLDVSGSMAGSGMRHCKAGVATIVKALRSKDMISVHSFCQNYEEVLALATKHSLACEDDGSVDKVEAMHAAGRTRLWCSMEDLLKQIETQYTRTFVPDELPTPRKMFVLTDGDDNCSDERAYQRVQELLHSMRHVVQVAVVAVTALMELDTLEKLKALQQTKQGKLPNYRLKTVGTLSDIVEGFQFFKTQVETVTTVTTKHISTEPDHTASISASASSAHVQRGAQGNALPTLDASSACSKELVVAFLQQRIRQFEPTHADRLADILQYKNVTALLALVGNDAALKEAIQEAKAFLGF
eukprot:m.3592 g.3592  ORF g.3592 m.3592 type:complete len:547 (+) comp4247_c0_seq1:493-2133(+)